MGLEAFFDAVGNFGELSIWLWILGGTFWGLLFGLVPGIGGLTGMALFLPFVFRLQPLEALPLMVTLAAVGFTGGSITAVLLGIPGESPNIATTFDGFPMTQKGEGGRALGAALMSSILGGVAPVFLALAMVFAILPLVTVITSMDMVFIIIIGLSFIALVGRGSMLKGLISGGIGMLISSIGVATVSGIPRFAFGIPYLYDGINLIPVGLGLFAIPPMVELAVKEGGGSAAWSVTVTKMHDVWKGAKDVFHHWTLWLRSSLIGYIFGVIPGVGSNVAVFVAYAQAKQISKHPELFGTGIVEGVIAPESCNNAKESGALLTTLALGIPGSATGALVLAGLLMLGLTPGPEMLKEHLDLSLTLLMAIAVANIIAGVICFSLAHQMAKVSTIPARILVPIVLVVIFAGSFAYQGLFEDIIVMLIFGVLAVVLRTLGYNLPALFLGYILGKLFEKYFFLAIQLGGPLFFLRPISLFLIFVLVALFAYSPLKGMWKRWLKSGAEKA